MCGIIGVIGGEEDAAPLLLEGLKRLEYRGYDSAGIATLHDGVIHRRRAEGKLRNLAAVLAENPMAGRVGIGHTRWATHGIPSESNAHPHATERVAVVHNGIIENFHVLRKELLEQGHKFHSDTDTEVIPVLLTALLEKGLRAEEAMRQTLARLEGAFALGVLLQGREERLIAARRGSPLALGYGEGAMYLGSDAIALAPYTNRVAYLEDGDWAMLTAQGAVIFDAAGTEVTREIRQAAVGPASVGKGNYRHFMQKEIFEQPGVIGEALNAYYNPVDQRVCLPGDGDILNGLEEVTIVACGTSYYAGMVAQYWIESLAGLPVRVDVASEFRYREPALKPGGLAVFISQSGETADTLAALRYCREAGQKIAAVVNVQESSMALEADLVLPIYAGPEIGVASTKAFTAQLTVLAALTLALVQEKGGAKTEEECARLLRLLAEVPSRAAEMMNHDEAIAALAHDIHTARDVLYLGRGTAYPIALEGALKLKEISYIHAEGYAAGEMKHGPIALIDEQVPVVVVAPSDVWFDKTASNVREAAARGAKIVLISDKKGAAALEDCCWRQVVLPAVDGFAAPILYVIPLQLLAYHIAVHKGTDVDQPRNLAKSVTVE